MSRPGPTRPVQRRAATGLLALSAVLALAACGSSDSDEAAADPPASAPGTSTGSATGSAPAGGLTAEAALAKAYAGITASPPTAAPAVAAGKSIWIVSCGQSQQVCSSESAAVTEAAELVGWTAKTCDGQLSPPGWQACVRQGIAAKADAVITIGLDCVTIQGALQEARAANVKTIDVGGADCSASGGEDLFSGSSTKLEGKTVEQFFNLQGELQADYLIGKTGAETKALFVRFTDAQFGGWIEDGFVAEMAKCSGCEISTTLEIANSDVGGGTLPTKVSTALLQKPDINAVAVPIDGWMFAGLAQAIASSGRSDELTVIGGIGTAGNFDLIREDKGQDASAAWSGDWDAWGGIDSAIRVFAGEPTVASGTGLQVVDKSNVPASGTIFAYTPEVDFKSAYKKIWGVA